MKLGGTVVNADCLDAVEHLVETYKVSYRPLLEADPAFASWMEAEYVPLAGAWQY